jgi:hypothetical protein
MRINCRREPDGGRNRPEEFICEGVMTGRVGRKLGLRELEAQHAKRWDGGRVCGTRRRRLLMDLGKDNDQECVVRPRGRGYECV